MSPTAISGSRLILCRRTLPKILETLQVANYHWYTSKKPVVISFPFAGGQAKSGVENTPKKLLRYFPEKFEHLDVREVPLTAAERKCNARSKLNEKNMKNFEATMDSNRKLYEEKVGVGAERKVLVLGGDHSLSMGSIGASLRLYKKLQVVWMNAHPDLVRPKDSKSGDMQEMNAAFLTGMEEETTCNFIQPKMSIDRIHHFGIRKFWEHEIAAFKKFKIRYATVKAINSAKKEAHYENLCSLVHPENPTHVSFDVGIMDPLEFPCTGTPVPKGVEAGKALKLLQFILGTFNVVSVDLTEANLELGSEVEREKSRDLLKNILDVIIN